MVSGGNGAAEDEGSGLMGEIIARIQMERTEGKTMSNDLVEAEVLSELESLSVDVEDSTYEATAVEAIESPKRKSGAGGVNQDTLARAIAFLSRAHHDAWPLVIKVNPGDPEDEVRKAMDEPTKRLDEAIWQLLHLATPLRNKGEQLLAGDAIKQRDEARKRELQLKRDAAARTEGVEVE
jgi:hypothetical protein